MHSHKNTQKQGLTHVSGLSHTDTHMDFTLLDIHKDSHTPPNPHTHMTHMYKHIPLDIHMNSHGNSHTN